MTAEEIRVIITAQTQDYERRLADAERQTREMQEELDRLSRNAPEARRSMDSLAAGANLLAKAFAGISIGKLITDSISEGMEAVESESLFETSLGSYADNAREWSQQLGRDLGLDEYALRKNVGTLFTMTNSMGVAKDNAIEMSQGMVQLAEDMASFYNISSDEAFNKLKSGLTGEAEPLKALGILVDENTVKQYAYANGIAEAGTELTQTQKVMARYGAIMQQTSVAQGDLARTMESPSNQLRALKNDATTLMRDFGTALLPTVSSLFAVAREGLTFISPMIKSLGEGIDSTAQAILNMSPSAKKLLLIALGAAVAIPAITKAQQLYNLANTGWKNLLGILIPQERTRANILKSTMGWLAIIAVLMAGVAQIGAKRREIDESKNAKSLEEEGKGAEKAAEGVDELADSYEKVSASGESTKRTLADIDTLNIFGGAFAGTGGLDFEAITTGAENATDSLDGVTDSIDDVLAETSGLQNQLDGLNLDGMGMNFSQTFQDIGTGFATMFDAFNFDSDTQLDSLTSLNENVKDIFGEDWTDFWEGVGSTLYNAFSEDANPTAKAQALKDVQGFLEGLMFMPDGWNDFWIGVGSSIYTNFINPDAAKMAELDETYGTLYADMQAYALELLQSGSTAWDAYEKTRMKFLSGDNEASYYYTQRVGDGQFLDLVNSLYDSVQANGGAASYSDYEYADFSPSAVPYKSAAGGIPIVPFDADSYDMATVTRSDFIEIHTTVELDGTAVGESVTQYQNGEAVRSNGY